ncbi:MAG: histidine phosphatase family protein [Microgenomates group bacterium]
MKNYCTLYLVRHGETDWNVKGLVQGHSDIPLNEKGRLQAEELAKKLSSVKFSAGFSSDLVRAKETAEIIALKHKINIITLKKLRERAFGRLEGLSWKKENQEKEELVKLWERLGELTEDEIKKHNLQGLETDDILMGRFIQALREIAIAYPNKNVLVVSHGGVMRAFLIHLGYATKDQLPSGSIDNTAYIKIFSDGVEFEIIETKGIRIKRD